MIVVFYRVALIVIVVVTVITLLLLPVDQDDWMQQMDPAIRPGGIRDASQNGRLTAGVLAMAGMAAALLLAITARTATGRLLATGAAMVVATVWLVKFAG